MEKTDRKKQNSIIKIVITGPESTGKSTIAKQLAEHYNTVWVKEYLREFAEKIYARNEELKFPDNLIIADGQLRLEQEALEKANTYIFCDTDILQTIVYSKVYYGKVQEELSNRMVNNDTSLYILTNLDVEWKKDPLRDRPNERQEIFDLIKKTISKYNQKYIVLEGKGEERLQNALNAIEKLHHL